MKKKLGKREAGKRLNLEGRLSPLEPIQERMEYYAKLANEEIKLGDLGSREKIAEFLKLAQEAAVELCPYRHPRLQATAISAEIATKIMVLRSPKVSKSQADWMENYVPVHLRKQPEEQPIIIEQPRTSKLMPQINGLRWGD